MVVSATFKLLLCGFGLIYWVSAELDKESPLSEIAHKTIVSIAHSCMDHVNATEVDLEHLREDPPFPEKSACILVCLLEKMGIVKNNRYSKMGFMMLITPLTFRNKKKLEHMRTVSENCENEVNHQAVTPCHLGNEITTCIFKHAPELHLKE